MNTYSHPLIENDQQQESSAPWSNDNVNYLSTSSSTQASAPFIPKKPQQQPNEDQAHPFISNNPSATFFEPASPFVPSTWIEPRETFYFKPFIPLLCSLIVPGSGHLLIGQFKKAVFYFGSFYSLWFLTFALSLIYIGIFLLPVVFAYYIVIFLDVKFLVDRLESAHAIMEGECGNRFALWGLWCAVEHPFLSGDLGNAPEEYINRF